MKVDSIIQAPLVTVVTIVKNDSQGLANTLASIIKQSYLNWECIVIVGKSSDDSFEMASKFSSQDSRIRMVMQRDNGIYEAMNLGIEEAKGDYLWFMNASDDFFSHTSLESAVAAIADSNHAFVVGGYAIKNEFKVYPNRNGRYSLIDLVLGRKNSCHQAMLFKSENIEEMKKYDCRYRLSSDYDLCIRILKKHSAISIDKPLAMVAGNGVTDKNLKLMHEEKKKIRRENFGHYGVYAILGDAWMNLALAKINFHKMVKANTVS